MTFQFPTFLHRKFFRFIKYMKTLFILRHAKSSWEDKNLADFDRPLNERGLKTAPMVGGKIYKREFQIDSINSSPAERAKQTAILIKKSAQITAEIWFDERIYEASPRRLLQIAAETKDDATSVLLVGHNPGLEGFIKFLTGEIEAMPTAALAVIDLKIERWNKITAGCGVLRKLFRPKEENDDKQ